MRSRLSFFNGLGIFFMFGTLWFLPNQVARAADMGNMPAPDFLVFMNGDRITGQLKKMDKGIVDFNSGGAGELKVPWAKVKELHSGSRFAVIKAKGKTRATRTKEKIPIGPIDVLNQNLTVHSRTGNIVIPVKTIAYLVDEKAYKTQTTSSLGVLQGWKGVATIGASTVSSTQNVTTFNSGISLSRSVPAAEWLSTSYRTVLDFNSTYGSISQPNNPTLSTNILHADAEQDKYLSRNFYLLGHAIFDQNSTQGLTLQQIYGLGLGYTLYKSKKQELDFSLSMDYTKQDFQDSSSNKELAGSTFGNRYFYKFPHDILLTENANITPQWNNISAYSANFAVGLVVPVLMRLGISLQMIDSYLNDPSPGFAPNSVQFNAGLSYSLK